MDLIFVKETPSELFWRSRHLITTKQPPCGWPWQAAFQECMLQYINNSINMLQYIKNRNINKACRYLNR